MNQQQMEQIEGRLGASSRLLLREPQVYIVYWKYSLIREQL